MSGTAVILGNCLIQPVLAGAWRSYFRAAALLDEESARGAVDLDREATCEVARRSWPHDPDSALYLKVVR